MTTNPLPEGVNAIQVTRYTVDELKNKLFDSAEAAAHYREQTKMTQKIRKSVADLLTILNPGPTEPRTFVEQNPEKIAQFRQLANQLLLNLTDAKSDWKWLLKPSNLGKDPLLVSVQIRNQEGIHAQSIALCYLKLARIDKQNREWFTPAEAMELGTKK